jgi:hypothetical protein
VLGVVQKNNNKIKFTKHTIEFSNNTLICFYPLRGNPASLIPIRQSRQAPVFGHP